MSAVIRPLQQTCQSSECWWVFPDETFHRSQLCLVRKRCRVSNANVIPKSINYTLKRHPEIQTSILWLLPTHNNFLSQDTICSHEEVSIPRDIVFKSIDPHQQRLIRWTSIRGEVINRRASHFVFAASKVVESRYSKTQIVSQSHIHSQPKKRQTASEYSV